MVVVLVRVETGVSYDQNTLRTMNSMNLGPSETTHRTPIPLTFAKVEQTDLSNEPYSGRSHPRIDTAGSLPDIDSVLQDLN